MSNPFTIHTEHLSEDYSFNMIKVEGGQFLLDDEIETHISTFYMAQYLVTQKLWKTIMNGAPSYFKGVNHPVDQVSRLEVYQFISKLNKKLKVRGSKRFRLPTEAEWEFAAKGGIYSKGYEYAGSNQLKEVGWYVENSGDTTHPVGEKLSNELDLYDMSGNLWEWCQDWYGKYSSGPLTDPTGPPFGRRCVLRGGSWFDEAPTCRVTTRRTHFDDIHDYDIGFRLARASV